MGEWKTDHNIKSVYRHSTTDREKQAKKDVFEKLQNARLLESCVMIHDKINDKI